MAVPLSAEWVTAIATVVYTVGTFLLWLVTRRSLDATRELFSICSSNSTELRSPLRTSDIHGRHARSRSASRSCEANNARR